MSKNAYHLNVPDDSDTSGIRDVVACIVELTAIALLNENKRSEHFRKRRIAIRTLMANFLIACRRQIRSDGDTSESDYLSSLVGCIQDGLPPHWRSQIGGELARVASEVTRLGELNELKMRRLATMRLRHLSSTRFIHTLAKCRGNRPHQNQPTLPARMSS